MTKTEREVVVLYSKSDGLGRSSDLPAGCPTETCRPLELGDVRCGEHRAKTVLVSGHSVPPRYLGTEADVLAARIACLSPELVVLDTCYGFSLPLLTEIARATRGRRVIVLGSTTQVGVSEVRLTPAIFAHASADERATAFRDADGDPLERWVASTGEAERTAAEVARWTPAQLRASLERVHPNLVRAPLGAATALVPVAPERFVGY